jgi:hypothetical protein
MLRTSRTKVCGDGGDEWLAGAVDQSFLDDDQIAAGFPVLCMSPQRRPLKLGFGAGYCFRKPANCIESWPSLQRRGTIP